eukprot:12742627-Ditylum_brightwellii.AAC.1
MEEETTTTTTTTVELELRLDSNGRTAPAVTTDTPENATNEELIDYNSKTVMTSMASSSSSSSSCLED